MTWREINRDEFWGWVLIALGGIALVYKPFNRVDDYLRGANDRALSMALVILAIALVLVSWRARPLTKAAVLFWMLSP
jgi:uncharacterized membrane protein YhaH (DUF805 family)